MYWEGIPLLVVGRWRYEGEGGRPALTTPQGVLFSWMGPVFISENGVAFDVPNPDSLLGVLPVVDGHWFFIYGGSEVL
jgi:hypothetical protein